MHEIILYGISDTLVIRDQGTDFKIGFWIFMELGKKEILRPITRFRINTSGTVIESHYNCV